LTNLLDLSAWRTFVLASKKFHIPQYNRPILVAALPVVVDVTSGRFYPLIFGRQQAQTIVLANLWKWLVWGKDGLEMTGLLRIGRPEISNLGSYRA
jgi:hypothetical protein